MRKKLIISVITIILSVLCLTFFISCGDNDDGDQDHTHTYSDVWDNNSTHHWHTATCGHASFVSEKAEHTFGDWTTTPATCLEEGSRQKSCSVCGYVVSEPIEKLNHNLTKVDKIEPTCTIDGQVLHYNCSICGKNFTAEDGVTEITNLVIPKSHDLIQVNKIEPSCITDGQVLHYNCRVCGKNFTAEDGITEITNLVIPKLGHNYVNDVCINCNVPYVRVDETGAISETGEYIRFGSYPQTRVSDDVLIQSLNGLAGTYTESNWTAFNYYADGVQSDYMYYTDLEYDGAKYRGIYITSYRPIDVYSPSVFDNSSQAVNGYRVNKAYWFKYEPLMWTILKDNGDSAVIICNLVIDSQQFDYDGTSSENVYLDSSIRTWLNQTFFNAFTEEEKGIIQDKTVDASQTEKVYLFSFEEAYTSYGFDIFAEKTATDYAKCQGYSNGWWMSSPEDNGGVTIVVGESDLDSSAVDNTSIGVCPAITIKLEIA